MAFCKYVKHKPGHNYWVYQRRVPTPLVELIGKTTWYQSLKTEEREVAHRRGLMIDADVEAEIARAYRILEGKPLAGDEISKIGETHFERTNAYLDSLSSRISGDDAAILRRAMPPTPTPNDLAGFIAWANSEASNSAPDKEPDPDFLRKGAQARLVTLLRCLEDGDYSLVQTFADHFYELQGLATRHRDPIDPDNPTTAPAEWVDIDRRRADYQALSRELMLKEIATVKRQLVQLVKAEMGHVDPPQMIMAPPVTAGSAPTELHPDATKTPMELLPRFFRDNPNVGKSTQRSFVTAIERLEEVAGKKSIFQVSKNDVIEFYELERVCPIKFKTILKATTMREAIAKNADGAVPTLDVDTIFKHVSHVRKFFVWARKFNLVVTDPVGDFRVERGDKVPVPGEEKEFELEELKAVFAQPNFMVPAGERGYRFWVPVVALWIGARLNEVCRLEMSDVQSANGVDWVMVLDSKARGKNKGRKYPVPIHPELRQIGFMDHIKAMREGGEKMLFPDAPRGSENGNAYQPVSKWFCRFLDKIGIERDGVGMHSFRHSFVGATRNSDISENMSEALVGHKSGSTPVHKGYGGGPSVEVLAEVMPKLVYRGLDLSHFHNVE